MISSARKDVPPDLTISPRTHFSVAGGGFGGVRRCVLQLEMGRRIGTPNSKRSTTITIAVAIIADERQVAIFSRIIQTLPMKCPC
jgi:hypothetical protein